MSKRPEHFKNLQDIIEELRGLDCDDLAMVMDSVFGLENDNCGQYLVYLGIRYDDKNGHFCPMD